MTLSLKVKTMYKQGPWVDSRSLLNVQPLLLIYHSCDCVILKKLVINCQTLSLRIINDETLPAIILSIEPPVILQGSEQKAAGKGQLVNYISFHIYSPDLLQLVY